MKRELNTTRSMKGLSVIELLVGLTIFGAVSAATVGAFFDVLRRAYDHETIGRTEDQAETIADMIAAEVRLIGAGIPFGQTNFAIGQAGLGTAPLPILLTSTNTSLQLRGNLSGAYSVLAATFTPNALNRTFSVLSSADFKVGDVVYLSNLVAGSAEGLRGVVQSVSGVDITIQAGYVTTAGATFASGSTANLVDEVHFNSPSDWSGVTRDDGSGAVIIAPNSTFVLEYLDENGNSMPLPLTNPRVASNLSAIEVTAFVRASKPLENGSIYSAEATRQIALRNLIVSR